MSADQLLPPIEVWGQSHKAQRVHNEDAMLIDLTIGLVVVADGVGGQDAGKVASGLTCEVLAREVAAGFTLVEALIASNQIGIAGARVHPKKNIVTQAVGAQSAEQLNIGTNRGSVYCEKARGGQIGCYSWEREK